MLDPKKVCIFCGEKPASKNKEHVLPRWLIEFTGHPKRIVELGVDYKKQGKRKFAFDQFTFPACESCNSSYSDLESSAKRVFEKVFSNLHITAQEIMILLNWFDKVRVGLWLAFWYLDKNPVGITPSYFISKRIGANDRMLGIYKTKLKSRRLWAYGIDSLPFRYTPSCFSLFINEYCFLNISRDFLFSHNLGFPQLKRIWFEKGGVAHPGYGELIKGTERIVYPILPYPFLLKPAVSIYQSSSIIPFDVQNNPFSSLYVKSHCLDWENSKSKIFFDDGRIMDNESAENYLKR